METYEKPVMEIVELDEESVIVTSCTQFCPTIGIYLPEAP